MHAICDKDVAQQVAQLTLQRALYVRNEYEFKLGWKYVLLEPMDLVTLTDAGLGLDKTPVRIIEIEEDEDGVLKVRAEDFPAGTANAAEYPTQDNGGYSADYNVAPGNASAPVMFEAPLQLTGNEPQIWLATGGGEYWGGCEVWVSADGDSYSRVGTVNTKARYGSLQNALPSGAVYDRINTADVQIGAGHLHGASEEEARQMVTACWLDGEFLAYQNAELTGLGRYTLSNLTRGAWGSAISEHAAGAPFVRLDEALFRYRFDKGWLGKTVWVKLVSFNVFGSGMQELGEVPAYPYTIIGAPLGEIANLRLTSGWTYGRDAVLAWDKLDGADSYDVEVYAAQSQTRLRRIEGIIDNRYSYTLADMKADGGQVRDVVFRVRARAVTGKTGNWAQAVARNPQLQPLSGIELDGSLKQVFFRCAAPQEEDFAGIRLWVSEQADCPTTDENLAYDGRDTFITVGKCAGKALEAGKTYYLRAAGYDSFGKDGLNISSSHAFTVYEVSAIAKELGASNLNKELAQAINDAGSVSAAVKKQEKAIAGLEAQYTVKVDVNGHVAGYGLATTVKNGKPTSAFIVSADRFGIGAAGKTSVYPFTVDSKTQTVGINGKLIVNGKAIIDKLNAGDISADKLQANSIGANLLKAGAVTAEKLAAKAVTAEKLQVDKLSAISADMGDITAGSLNIGKGRFTVDEEGNVAIKADAKRKTGTAISNHGIVIRDEQGRIRVVLGDFAKLTN